MSYKERMTKHLEVTNLHLSSALLILSSITYSGTAYGDQYSYQLICAQLFIINSSQFLRGTPDNAFWFSRYGAWTFTPKQTKAPRRWNLLYENYRYWTQTLPYKLLSPELGSLSFALQICLLQLGSDHGWKHFKQMLLAIREEASLHVPWGTLQMQQWLTQLGTTSHSHQNPPFDKTLLYHYQAGSLPTQAPFQREFCLSSFGTWSWAHHSSWIKYLNFPVQQVSCCLRVLKLTQASGGCCRKRRLHSAWIDRCTRKSQHYLHVQLQDPCFRLWSLPWKQFQTNAHFFAINSSLAGHNGPLLTFPGLKLLWCRLFPGLRLAWSPAVSNSWAAGMEALHLHPIWTHLPEPVHWLLPFRELQDTEWHLNLLVPYSTPRTLRHFLKTCPSCLVAWKLWRLQVPQAFTTHSKDSTFKLVHIFHALNSSLSL